ncbi:hypothetical protein DENIS_4935 [Desulfonema ishimotonii]|uniref:Uncharacterized protein n=1 Tax=Desulfonema ishimotonii TaxID=45657 RepID=A0A401G485_9BACT|nr:hypothetical protein [Desulfonema ishimotonii]GBC63935.1 hypothetical protein DENIS_4935 [Desulfonema ishimotonii]
MKPFGIWLIISLLGFGGLGSASHLYLSRHPRKVLVALDSSFPMKPVWPRVDQTLETLGRRRYTQFGLITEKNRIHSWAPRLTPGRITPYAPRDFSKLENATGYPETEAADEKILLTNATQEHLARMDTWEVIRLTP